MGAREITYFYEITENNFTDKQLLQSQTQKNHFVWAKALAIAKCHGEFRRLIITLLLLLTYLKLASPIFIIFLFFNQIIALQKLWKMLFMSSKKLFSFSRYSNFCISVLPSFSTCRPLLWRMIEDKS